ncbi:MAG: Sec-independent protein translocase protein TatB [Candidatus Polarisedimenticolaceae bacterium]|nr:Sec-independent protein translocase protein TatB [Candidatus Polarisedimenticolaceae bacterium]
MFDIGFWELGLISVVALLVVGPERLPGLARTLGLWLGKGRRMLSSIKDEIDREVRVDEIKKAAQEGVKSPVSKSIRQAVDPMQTIGLEAEKIMNEARSQLEEGDQHKKKGAVKAASSNGAHGDA